MPTQGSATRYSARLNIFPSLALFAATFAIICAIPARSQTFTVLYEFAGTPDAGNPFAGLIADPRGNFYGTTYEGGTSNNGAVFEMSPPSISGGEWTESVIWSFPGGAEGANPDSPLVRDSKGRLYGETSAGGDATCGCGIVFALVPPATPGAAWTERVIWTPTSSGFFFGGLTPNGSGSLFGIMQTGGTFNGGIAFELTPSAGGFTETTIYNFGAVHGDSKDPLGPLTMDKSGNLYGVSLMGVGGSVGTVYELKPPASGSGPWSNSVLKSFNDQNGDGEHPEGNLILDKTGRLYGQFITPGGFFRLTPPKGSGPWVYSLLFQDSVNGFTSNPSLTFDSKKGVFYGTSTDGAADGGIGDGVVVQLTPPVGGAGSWTETILYAFSGGTDGFQPRGPLVVDANGVLYGVTELGAASGGLDGNGTVFSINP